MNYKSEEKSEGVTRVVQTIVRNITKALRCHSGFEMRASSMYLNEESYGWFEGKKKRKEKLLFLKKKQNRNPMVCG